MSLNKAGIDAHHRIQQFQHGKQLGTLAEEEDAYRAQIHSNGETYTPKKVYVMSTKADLESFKYACKDKTPDEIFDKLGIEVKYNENGSKTISDYKWPFKGFSFKLAGIDEEKLLEGVTRIEGDCNLIGSSLKSLGDVSSIGGDLEIPVFGDLKDLSSIKYIGGDIYCDTEEAKDTVDKLKDLKLAPKYFRGYINPDQMVQGPILLSLYSNMPTNMKEAINQLQLAVQIQKAATENTDK